MTQRDHRRIVSGFYVDVKEERALQGFDEAIIYHISAKKHERNFDQSARR